MADIVEDNLSGKIIQNIISKTIKNNFEILLGVWIGVICVCLIFCMIGGLVYFTLKHFMKGPLCYSKARY